MPDYLPIPRFPLPSDLTPDGTMCVRVTIPNDPQYLGTLVGLIDLLKWSRNFARDPSGTGAAIVSRTWQSALESQPIEVEGCVDFRINPDTCLLEVNCSDDPDNPDWQPVKTTAFDPTRDTPTDPPYPDPPPSGQSNECLAAANTTSYLKWGIGNFVDALLASGIFGVLIQVIYTAIITVTEVYTQSFYSRLTTVLGQLDVGTIEADYDAFDWQVLQDILVCHYQPNGSMTELGWENAHIEFEEQFDDTENQIWLLIILWWDIFGTVGATNAALWGGITEAECALCGITEYCIDFTETDGGFSIRDAGEGLYELGTGWKNDLYQRVVIERTIAQCNVRTITVTYSASGGASGFQQVGLILEDDSVTTAFGTPSPEIGVHIVKSVDFGGGDLRAADLLQLNIWLSDVMVIESVCIGIDGDTNPFD